MSTIKEIEITILETLKELGVKRPSVDLEHPTDLENGDYSTNVAFVYGKKIGISPLEVAREIVASFNKKEIDGLDRVEIAGFGFINFYLNPNFFANQIENILNNREQYGSNQTLKNKKIVIEYTDPNPFKEFHIGHMMANAIGESLSRIMEFQRADLKRVCYQGDVGMHIAKSIFGIFHNKWQFWKVSIFGSTISKANFLGKAYAYGARSYADDLKAKQDIIEINKEVYLRNNPKVNKYYDTGRKWSLDYFDYIYKILGTKFDKFFFESETVEIGQKLVEEYLDKEVFELSDGAVIFPGEKYGLHTRVFINSEGLPTYEAKELGLAHIKYESLPADEYIVVTADEQTNYFKVVLKALEIISPQLAEKITHISHGFLMLPSGKMSSRTGDVVTAMSLIESVKENILIKMKDRGFNSSEADKIATEVAVGAIKFVILRQSPGKDVIFDLEKSISFEGDSGPYLQYSYVRAMSVLNKAKALKIPIDSRKTNKEVIPLEQLIYRFPEIIKRAEEENSPHFIVSYLLELASTFNGFYGQYKITDSDNIESPYRLALTESFATIMKTGLNLLAIEAPDRM